MNAITQVGGRKPERLPELAEIWPPESGSWQPPLVFVKKIKFISFHCVGKRILVMMKKPM